MHAKLWFYYYYSSKKCSRRYRVVFVGNERGKAETKEKETISSNKTGDRPNNYVHKMQRLLYSEYFSAFILLLYDSPRLHLLDISTLQRMNNTVYLSKKKKNKRMKKEFGAHKIGLQFKTIEVKLYSINWPFWKNAKGSRRKEGIIFKWKCDFDGYWEIRLRQNMPAAEDKRRKSAEISVITIIGLNVRFGSAQYDTSCATRNEINGKFWHCARWTWKSCILQLNNCSICLRIRFPPNICLACLNATWRQVLVQSLQLIALAPMRFKV